MRFAKSEILEWFDRQDRSYRLAILSSHWLRDTAHFKPSAADEASGLKMRAGANWVSFADLAELLQQQNPREIITSDFMLNHLHALIRSPFELLQRYCADYDSVVGQTVLMPRMKNATWYQFARLIRNAISHDLHFDFTDDAKRQMPITWNGITLSADLDGKPITYESFWHQSGYKLFLEMREFADALPERAP